MGTIGSRGRLWSDVQIAQAREAQLSSHQYDAMTSSMKRESQSRCSGEMSTSGALL